MTTDEHRDLRDQARRMREHSERCLDQVRQRCADSARRVAASRHVLDTVRPGA